MPIEATTVYTPECLLRYQNYLIASKKILHIICALAMGSIVMVMLLNIILWGDFSIVSRVAISAVLYLFYIFFSFIYPRLSVRKANNLHTKVRFIFEEEQFLLQVSNEKGSESASYQYSILTKVGKKGNDLYLFIAPQRAYIVDLSDVPEEKQIILHDFLQTKFKRRNFKWKK